MTFRGLHFIATDSEIRPTKQFLCLENAKLCNFTVFMVLPRV